MEFWICLELGACGLGFQLGRADYARRHQAVCMAAHDDRHGTKAEFLGPVSLLPFVFALLAMFAAIFVSSNPHESVGL